MVSPMIAHRRFAMARQYSTMSSVSTTVPDWERSAPESRSWSVMSFISGLLEKTLLNGQDIARKDRRIQIHFLWRLAWIVITDDADLLAGGSFLEPTGDRNR